MWAYHHFPSRPQLCTSACVCASVMPSGARRSCVSLPFVDFPAVHQRTRRGAAHLCAPHFPINRRYRRLWSVCPDSIMLCAPVPLGIFDIAIEHCRNRRSGVRFVPGPVSGRLPSSAGIWATSARFIFRPIGLSDRTSIRSSCDCARTGMRARSRLVARAAGRMRTRGMSWALLSGVVSGEMLGAAASWRKIGSLPALRRKRAGLEAPRRWRASQGFRGCARRSGSATRRRGAGAAEICSRPAPQPRRSRRSFASGQAPGARSGAKLRSPAQDADQAR